MRQLYIGRYLNGINSFFKMGWKYNLSPEAEYRLKVIGYYFNKSNKNASLTGRYFGLHRNTVMDWLKRFDPHNLHSLEPKKSAPIRTYRRKTPEQIVQKIITLKKQYPVYNKNKIAHILQRDYDITISASTCGRVFKKYKLTFLWRRAESAMKFKKHIKKRQKKKRPPKHKQVSRPGEWTQVDTVIIYHAGQKVYVINAIDLYSRLAISYAYKSPSSKNAKDFLDKLELFFPGYTKVEMVQTDNGSEFLKYFDLACTEKNITHTFSYARCPKMNSFVESFNGTIQRECLLRTDALMEIVPLNKKINDYLIEYNSFRPHDSLDFATPLDVYCQYLAHSAGHLFDPSNVHKKIWTHSIG